jgi:hypothetical protein
MLPKFDSRLELDRAGVVRVEGDKDPKEKWVELVAVVFLPMHGNPPVVESAAAGRGTGAGLELPAQPGRWMMDLTLLGPLEAGHANALGIAVTDKGRVLAWGPQRVDLVLS